MTQAFIAILTFTFSLTCIAGGCGSKARKHEKDTTAIAIKTTNAQPGMHFMEMLMGSDLKFLDYLSDALLIKMTRLSPSIEGIVKLYAGDLFKIPDTFVRFRFTSTVTISGSDDYYSYEDSIDVEQSIFIGELKKRIQDRVGIPANAMVLTVAGRQLLPGKLSPYGLSGLHDLEIGMNSDRKVFLLQ